MSSAVYKAVPRTADEARELQRSTLKWLNFAAFLFHGLSFIGALTVAVVFHTHSPSAQITFDFRRYDAMSMAPPSVGPVSTTLESVNYYQLVWLILPPSIVAALFHGTIAVVPWMWKRYERQVIDEQRNDIRWIEYAISNTFIIWVVLQLAGVTNLFMLLAVAVMLNGALQAVHYAMESLNTPVALKARKQFVDWVPAALGAIFFLSIWAVVLAYFLVGVVAPRPPGAPLVLWYDWAEVMGVGFLLSVHGMVMLSHYFRSPHALATGAGTETAYIGLSLITKLFATWTLLAGMLTTNF